MSTSGVYADIYRKRLLGTEDFRDRIVDYMRTLVQESMERSFPSGSVHDTQIDLSAGGTDRVTVGTGGAEYATDGLGHVFALAQSAYMTAYFENTNAIPYYVLLHEAEVPDGVQINPRSGLPEYIGIREEIGLHADPDSVSVVGGGTQLEFIVDSVTEAGVSNAGRTVAVWKIVPGDNATTEAVAVQYLTVTWDGSNNKITTADLMGQSPASTTAADYQVCLLGPVIKRNGSWDATTADYCFIGAVTGAGAGNPPTAFDMGGQRVAVATLDDLADITSRHPTTDRLKIDVKSYAGDSTDEQIAVRDTGGAIVFSVDGDGNMYVAGTQDIYDTVTVYSSETITDNLSAGDATSDTHTIKGTWHHTDVAGTANYFRVDGVTGHVGINRLPDASAWLAVQGDIEARHIVPETTGLYDLGASGVEWRNFYVQTLTLSGDFDPASDAGPDIGDRTLRWNNINAREGHFLSNTTGYTALSRTMAGAEFGAIDMNTTSKFTPAVKFMSADANFTTENPKLLAAIVGEATEGYFADTDGGMSIVFAATPDDPGASSLPTPSMRLMSTNLQPYSHELIDLGSTSVRWRDAYIGRTLNVDSATMDDDLSLRVVRYPRATGSIEYAAQLIYIFDDPPVSSFPGVLHLIGDCNLGTGESHGQLRGILNDLDKDGDGDLDSWYANRVNYSVNGGTVTSINAYYAGGAITSGTVTNLYGFHYDEPTVGGTLTTQYGVDISAMSLATTNYGVRIRGASPGYSLYVDGGDYGAYFEGASTAAIYVASDKSYFVDASTVAGTIYGSAWNPKVGVELAPGTISANAQALVAYASIAGISGARVVNGIAGTTDVLATATSGTMNRAAGVYGQVYTHHPAGCTFTHANALEAWVGNVNTGTIGNAYGLYVWEHTKGSGTITTSYGIYLEAQTEGVTNYGLYLAGASTASLFMASGMTYLVDAATIGASGFSGWNIGKFAVEWDPGTLTANTYGTVLRTNIDAVSGTRNVYSAYGNLNLASGISSGTITHASGIYCDVDSSHVTGSTVTHAHALEVWVANRGTGTMTNAYGIYCWDNNNWGSGEITNNHGVWIGTQTEGVTNYGLYVKEASPGYSIFVEAGDVRFEDGKTAVLNPAGLALDANTGAFEAHASFASPTTNKGGSRLSVRNTGTVTNKNLTGVSIWSDHGVTSGTTTYSVGAYAGSYTAAGAAGTVANAQAFAGDCSNSGTSTATMSKASVFHAWNGAAGGGAITDYHGLYVRNLTVGTNNYGVYLEGASTAAFYAASGKSYFMDSSTLAGTPFPSTWDPKVGVHWAPGAITANGQGFVSVAEVDGLTGTLSIAGGEFSAELNASCNSGALGRQQGIYAQVHDHHSSGCTVNNAHALVTCAGLDGTGTITNMYGLYCFTNTKSAGTVTSNYGVYIQNQNIAGATNYGLRILGASPGYALYVDSGDCYIGDSLNINTAPGNHSFKIHHVMDAASGDEFAANVNFRVDDPNAGAIAGSMILNHDVNLTTGETQANLYGLFLQLDKDGAGTISNWYGVRQYASCNLGVVTNLHHYIAYNSVAASTTVTNLWGYHYDQGTITGTVTYQTGLDIDDLTGAGTNYGVRVRGADPGWAIYVDADKSYFGGDVGIYSTSPAMALDVIGPDGIGEGAPFWGTTSGNTAVFRNNNIAASPCSVYIIAGYQGSAGLFFGDKDDRDPGGFRYTNTDPSFLSLRVSGADRFEFRADGRIRGINHKVPLFESSLSSPAQNTGTNAQTYTICTIPANTLTTGDVIEIDLGAIRSDALGPLTWNYIQIGGQTVATMTPTIDGNTEQLTVTVRCNVTASGASGTLATSAKWTDSTGVADAEVKQSVSIDTTAGIAITYVTGISGSGHTVDIPVALVRVAI
jgi:hypothetical protein